MHPIGGLDHILAMVAVGMFAAYLGGRALWLVPTAFVLMMAAGGVLGIMGVDVPFVETGIAASVIMLGLAVGLRVSLPSIVIVHATAIAASLKKATVMGCPLLTIRAHPRQVTGLHLDSTKPLHSAALGIKPARNLLC